MKLLPLKLSPIRSESVVRVVVILTFAVGCAGSSEPGSSTSHAGESTSRPESEGETTVMPPVEPDRSQPEHDAPANRLIHEKSPYLLQHAHNPVDWYPWGEEALARAKAEDKPIFLSIGYSTCHWCHVMERESFENPRIAALMNENFVCIKVDREERPDLDEIYMAAVQRMTGQGGWPLNVFLTPELVPFFGGTYFPPDDRFGRPGFPKLLQSIAQAWTSRRPEIEAQAKQLHEALSGLGTTLAGDAEIARGAVDAAMGQLAQNYDSSQGGWGSAPKFPRSDYGRLCLRSYYRSGDEKALQMALHTLDRMAAGGIYDHLGGGFARYSTDDGWLVPHFEKMLYDNAQLALHYLEAYQLTGRESYAAVARGVFEYVLRDMTHSSGGFYSAEDADSEGEEGRFYVWTLDEVRSALTPDEASVFVDRFGVSAEGNWEGKNILELRASIDSLARQHEMDPDEVIARLESARRKLFELRAGRVRPSLDDKVLTAWNGLMIEAFARGAAVLDEPRYLEAASRAADFVLTTMRDERGLLRRWREDEARYRAYAEDYAMFVSGLLELYQAGFEVEILVAAQELHEEMFSEFGDEDGALFNTRAGQSDLLVRTKTGYDGSVPTANSVAAANALKLFELSGDSGYADQTEAILRAFAPTLARSPLALSNLLLTADAWFGERVELVLAGQDRSMARRWMTQARAGYLPDLVVSFRPRGDEGSAVERLLPSLAGKDSDDAMTAYVCRGFACRQPRRDAAQMLTDLELLRR
jgi:uncharacterized protein